MSLDEDAEINAKVADFGLTQRVDPALTEFQGTFQWHPAEMIDPSSKSYDAMADIYSMGMVFWELAARELPFTEFTEYIKKTEETLKPEELTNEPLIEQIKKDGWQVIGNKMVKEEFKVVPLKKAIISNSLRPTIPSNCPEEFAEIIRKCWQHKPIGIHSYHKIILEIQWFCCSAVS